MRKLLVRTQLLKYAQNKTKKTWKEEETIL